MSPTPTGPRQSLRRTLNVWQVALSGVGVILGAGVYALLGPAAALAGNALWLSFVLAAVAAAFTAFSYARLSGLVPKNSPEFQYASRAFGPRLGFTAGWLMVSADLLASAAVALGFGSYLAHLTGLGVTAGALLLLAGAAVLLYRGIGESVGVAVALTFVEAAGLALVIVSGVPAWGSADFQEMPLGLAGVSSAVSLIFFAYLGFDEIGNLAEEMVAPERDMPRAMGLALAGATVIYVLVALSAIAAVGWEALAASTAPLAVVMQQRLGPAAGTLVSVMALAATSNTVLLLLVSASRSLYGMARSGVLPVAVGSLGPRRVPAVAVTVALLVTGLLVLSGGFQAVAEMTNATVLLVFALVHAALVRLGVRGETGVHGFRRALDVAVPAVGVGVCLWLLAGTGLVQVTVAVSLAVGGWLLGVVAGRGFKPEELA